MKASSPTRLGVAAVLLLALGAPAPACGPYALLTYFWDQAAHGLPLARLLDGEVVPFEHLRPIEAFVLYRWLTENPIAPDQHALLTMEVDPRVSGVAPPVEAAPSARWLAARRVTLDAYLDGQQENVAPPGQVDSAYRRGEAFAWYRNCHDDAFRVATSTLELRAMSWGRTSPHLLEWLRGQDAVFANCGGGHFLPAPIQADWPATLRHDRAYQLAAAHFYSERWDEAEARFLAMGDDPESPWQATSAYVAARAMARQGKYREAHDQLRAVLDDPVLLAVHAAAERLLRFVRYRFEPAAMHTETREALIAPRLPEDFAQRFTDYRWGLRHVADLDSDLDLWTLALGQARNAQAPQTVIARQKALASLDQDPVRLWRVAASTLADRAEATTAIIDTVVGSTDDDVEASVLAFHRARLLLDRARFDEAATIIDTLAQVATSWPRGARNRLRVLEARAGVDLPAFFSHAAAPPNALSWGGEYPADFAFVGIDDDAPILLDLGVSVLQQMPVRAIADLAGAPYLPKAMRDRLLEVAFLRALILEDHPTLEAVAPRVVAALPRLAGGAESYLAADPDARSFVAALVLLWTEQRPWFEYGVRHDHAPWGSRGWWCGGPWTPPAHDPLPPMRAELAVDEAERATLASLRPAPEVLADRVFPWADAHRDDPRVPEALHRLIYTTRWACGQRFGDISKAAFERLHHRYPKSPWTEKTPYWFGS